MYCKIGYVINEKPPVIAHHCNKSIKIYLCLKEKFFLKFTLHLNSSFDELFVYLANRENVYKSQ